MRRPIMEVAVLGISIISGLLPLSCGEAHAAPPRGKYGVDGWIDGGRGRGWIIPVAGYAFVSLEDTPGCVVEL